MKPMKMFPSGMEGFDWSQLASTFFAPIYETCCKCASKGLGRSIHFSAMFNNLRQFDAHEDAAHEEGDDDGGESNTQQQDAVEAWHERLVHLIQHDEAQTAQREHETGGQTLHMYWPFTRHGMNATCIEQTNVNMKLEARPSMMYWPFTQYGVNAICSEQTFTFHCSVHTVHWYKFLMII